MTGGLTTLTLTVVPVAGSDAVGVHRLTLDLADQLRSLDFVAERLRVPSDEADHRAGTAVAVGTLLATGMLSKPVLSALVALVQAWLRRHDQDKVIVEVDG